MTPVEKAIRKNQLASTKAINSLKHRAINNGGYKRFRDKILAACKLHKELYNIDLTPQHIA